MSSGHRYNVEVLHETGRFHYRGIPTRTCFECRGARAYCLFSPVGPALLKGDRHSLTFEESCSGHLRRPAPLTGHVIGPALAAAGEVLAVGDQPLVQLAGENRDAVHPCVMPKPVAGHADLAAAGLEQDGLVEVGPLLDRGIEPGIQCCGPGERGTHD